MASLDAAAAREALKVLYDGQKLMNLTYKDHPWLAAIPKKEDFFGRNYPLPIQRANPQGRSASFAKAQAQKSPSRFNEFLLTRSKDYALASIDNEMVDASKSDKGAFVSLLENEIDSSFRNLSQTMSLDVFGDGSGSRGRLAASQNLASSTVVLASDEDIVDIEVDMKLVLSATNGTGTVKAGAMYVVSVNRDAGTFVVSATLQGAPATIATCIATAAASDYIFVDGDYGVKIKGLAAWIPDVAPTSGDSFFGVDRSVDPTRLAGTRLDISSYTIEEGLQQLLRRMGREGAAPDTIWLNQVAMQDLILSLGSKVIYQNLTLGGVGFRAVQINGPKGVVNVMQDKSCPVDRAYAVTTDSWKFASLYRAPRILEQDGNRVLRETDADAIEVRIGYYGQVGCMSPVDNGVGFLSNAP
jgi:hypothetical protein